MKAFEVGETYGVLHMDDRRETVTIAARDGSIVRFSDGRTARVLAGIAPDSTDEECIRLDEVGPVATGAIHVQHAGKIVVVSLAEWSAEE